MSLRVCLKCSTVYAVGLQVCPHCGAKTRNARYNWEDDVAKANAYGSTFYVAEGQALPTDLPDEVQLVGPGAPKPESKPESKAESKAPEPVKPPQEPGKVPAKAKSEPQGKGA